MPTICQVLHSLTIGGAEMLAFRLAKQLAGQFRFVFACLDGLGPLGMQLRDAGLPVELLKRKAGLDLGCARRLATFTHEQRVDLIHAHQYTPFFYATLSGMFRRRPPILFNEHGRFHPDYRSTKRVLFNRLMLRKRDRVVAVGNSVRQALIDNEGISGERIQVIYNGMRLPDTSTDERSRMAVRQELGMAADEFVLLQVARLDPIKDHATAIRTVRHVARQQPRVRLLIVGDGPERDKIGQEIRRQTAEPWVRVLGERKDVPRLLSGADAFLLTSLSEGIPVTIIEAMGAGLPVVSTEVGGVGEVVEREVTGLLAPAGADEALAGAILRLMNDAKYRLALGQAGRKRAEAMFTEERMHGAYAKVYEEMLGCQRSEIRDQRSDHEPN